jgi:protein-tyrosine phosphatase/adenylate kinase family enzyme
MVNNFILCKSSLYLVGDSIEIIAKKYLDRVPEKYKVNRCERDGNQHHITIYFDYIDQQYPENIDVYPIGLGCDKNKEVYFVVVYYPAGDKISKNYFHITLGFKNNDLHNFDKNIKTVIEYEDYNDIITNLVKYPSIDTDKQLIVFEHLNNLLPITIASISIKPIILFNLCKLYGKNKKFNECESTGYQLLDHNIVDASYILIKLYKYTNKNYDMIIQKLIEYIQYNSIIMECLLDEKEKKFLMEELNNSSTKWYYYFDDNQPKSIRLPINFSKVFDNIYGAGDPENYETVINLLQIKDVITLTEKKHKLTTIHFPIEDHKAPTHEQMVEIISFLDQNQNHNVLIHCLGGVGRTNIVLICYLMYHRRIPLSEASEYVKTNRHKMILTQAQINFAKNFQSFIEKNNYSFDIVQIKNNKHKNKLPKLVIMCGYPCSGKSTLSQLIVDNTENCIRINQDEMGQKKCLEEASKNIKNNKTVIIDKTNLTQKERFMWAELFMLPESICIFMDYDINECLYRSKKRKEHKIENMENILVSLKNKLEKPDIKFEPYFKEIIVINDDTIKNFMEKIGIEDNCIYREEPEFFIVKFPRTKHLLNLGAATRDDLIMDKREQQQFLDKEIYIEEKIDGANFGISIKDGTLVCQNRSHYVDSKYHSQFKDLDKWLFGNQTDLYQILTDDFGSTDTFILFGEWVYAKHSIGYTKLPSYFVAFDLFNKKTGMFISRDFLEKKLFDTKIPIINLISKTTINKVDDLKKFIGASAYYDGPMEGIYIRICEDSHTTQRGKVVRTNFLSSDNHWSKNILVKNIIL